MQIRQQASQTLYQQEVGRLQLGEGLQRVIMICADHLRSKATHVSNGIREIDIDGSFAAFHS